MVSLLLLLVALVNASVIPTTAADAHAVDVFAHWYGCKHYLDYARQKLLLLLLSMWLSIFLVMCVAKHFMLSDALCGLCTAVI